MEKIGGKKLRKKRKKKRRKGRKTRPKWRAHDRGKREGRKT